MLDCSRRFDVELKRRATEVEASPKLEMQASSSEKTKAADATAKPNSEEEAPMASVGHQLRFVWHCCGLVRACREKS